ncbi:MAG: hypothetical protein WAL30_05555 [Candidatus Aquirickettsiella sp.]
MEESYNKKSGASIAVDLQAIHALLKLVRKNKTTPAFLNNLQDTRLRNSELSSEEFWLEMIATQKLADELLGMIELGLNIFHPYLPMTDVKRQGLLDCFEKQQAASAKISQNKGGNVTIKAKLHPQFFDLGVNDACALHATESNGYTHSN